MAKTQVREILQSDDTRKEKITYLWEYYKWHVFIAIAAILFVIYMIFQLVNRTRVDFNIGVLGPETTTEQEQVLNADLKQLMDPEDEQEDMVVTITPEGQFAERFFAQLTAAEYDLILMTETAFENMGSGEGMQLIEVEGIENEALRYFEGTESVIGIDSSAIPFFESHPETQGMIAMVPQNVRNTEELTRFFEEQEQGIRLSE